MGAMITGPRSLLLPCLALAGGVLGWQAKRASTTKLAHGPAAQPSFVSSEIAAAGERSTLRSPDSADDLLQLPSNELYGRLALFLLDLEPAAFPNFFQEYLKREDQTADLTSLILIARCRVDAATALQTTQDTELEPLAYRALAGHDPERALRIGLTDRKRLKTVATAIGEFHPKWLSENWARIPVEAQRDALLGLAK